MIVNQVIGRSFKGALAYAFGKEGSEPGFSNLAHSPHDNNGINRMASEFIAVAEQRPNLSRSVAHIQFSPNPGDDISDEKFQEAIQFWMDEMGYGNSLYAVAFHSDTDIRHAHLVTSRVDLDGEVVSDANNYARNIKVTRELEQRFGLIVTEPNNEASPTPKWQKDRALPPHDYIKEAIKQVGSSSPSMPDFISGLNDLGVDVELQLSADKSTCKGISFAYDDYAVSGSKVGYSAKKLEQKLGVKYERADYEADTRNVSQRANQHEAGEQEISGYIDRGIEAPGTGAGEEIPVSAPSAIRGFFNRIAGKIDSIRERFAGFRRDDGELSPVVDQQQRNGRLFEEIFGVLERRDSSAMTLKKSMFGEMKQNMHRSDVLEFKPK